MKEGQARGVGTIKILAMDEVCRMEISITGCGNVQGKYPVYVVSGDLKSLIGEITLMKGKGSSYLKCKTNAIGHMAFPYGKLTGIYIDLKTEGSLEQTWLPVSREKEVREKAVTEERCVKEPEEKESPKPPEKETFNLYSCKWQQLCAIYPIVHPFNDGRAYLSIEPRDFVVLQERFQPLVQNSFLLHGFYHYKHLLLGRRQQGKCFLYYLGVPGMFYEKEKAAALFYGFENFEGAVTPASEGSFGYYMKRVQI
jgi:hypothetical protein